MSALLVVRVNTRLNESCAIKDASASHYTRGKCKVWFNGDLQALMTNVPARQN